LLNQLLIISERLHYYWTTVNEPDKLHQHCACVRKSNLS